MRRATRHVGAVATAAALYLSARDQAPAEPGGPARRVFEPSGEEILCRMRPWFAGDPDARAWVSAIHRRGEPYAKRQLGQLRRALFHGMRRDLSKSTDPGRVRHLRLREAPLLAAVMRASRALDRTPGSPTDK